MHPIAKHLAAAVLALGTALATVSSAQAAPEQGLIQQVQYYRHGYPRPYYRHRYYGGGYYHRPFFRQGPGFYRRGYYRHGYRY